MAKKNQSARLTTQHRKSQGVVGIFGAEAKMHDKRTSVISRFVLTALQGKYPQLTFRYRPSVEKKKSTKPLKRLTLIWGKLFSLKMPSSFQMEAS